MLNITAAWQASHAHLKPYRNHLPLSQDQLQRCPECGGVRAYYVVANLFLPSGIGINGVHVLYCHDCENFMIDPSIGGRDSGESSGITSVEGVDARLWSPLPTFLNVEPTTRCNFRCWYCIGRHMEQRDISVASFAKILEHTPTVATIALVGEGEPLLHPDFFTMARTATAQNMKVVIISNGSLLNDENIKNLCESGVICISISLDSTDPGQFSQSRINGSLSAVLRGISRLRTFRDQHGFQYPKIAVKGTLLDYSEHEMLDIVELARAHGAEIFESFQSINQKHSYVEIYPEEHRGQLASAQRIAVTIGRDSEPARRMLRPFGDFFAEEGIEFGGSGRANILRCNCDEQYIYTLLSGDITPCCQVKNIINPEWNLLQQPLTEIFRNQHYENLRFNLWNGLFPEYCAGCGKTT